MADLQSMTLQERMITILNSEHSLSYKPHDLTFQEACNKWLIETGTINGVDYSSIDINKYSAKEVFSIIRHKDNMSLNTLRELIGEMGPYSLGLYSAKEALNKKDAVLLPFNNVLSLNFDSGDDEYVDIGDSDDLMVGTNVTVSTWFKNSSGTRAYMFQSRRGSTSTNLSVGVNMNASGAEEAGWIGIVIYTGSGHSYISVDGNVDDGAWHHFAATISDGGQKLYLDGSLIASATNAFPNDASGHHSIIGSNSGSDRFMNGNISEVALWNTVLDPDAITAIYNSRTPISLSSDSGNYDNSSNLKGWWRMGDGTDLPYPFIPNEKGTVGAELVVDGSSNWVGDFDVSGDISSWTSTDSGELAISHDSSNNAMQLTGGSSSSGKWVYYTATVEVGELYAVSLKMISRNNSGTTPNIRVGRTVGGTEYYNTYYSTFITQGKIFRASTNTTCIIAISVNGNDNDAGFDSISLKKVSEQTGLMINMEAGNIEGDAP